MPKLYNTVTQKWMFMPDSYVGKHPFQTEAEVAAVEAPAPAPAKKPARKRKAEYVSPTFDADGDGMVQDGTIFERPVDTELSPEEVTAILEEADKE
jgi:hypothetical protein